VDSGALGGANSQAPFLFKIICYNFNITIWSTIVNHEYISLTIYCQAEKIIMAINRKLLLYIANLNDKSISELAAKNDIPQSNLSKWFNEKKGGYVREEKIDRMAKSLGVDYKTGKFLPGIHWWRVLTSKEGVPFVTILNSLSPAGGELVFVRIETDYEDTSVAAEGAPEWGGDPYYVTGGVYVEYIVVIPYDRSFRLIVDIGEPSAFYCIENELKKTKSSWKFKKNKEGRLPSLTFEIDAKRIIDRFENKSLSVADLDTILGKEDSPWTWERLVFALKAQGQIPGEVAKRLGL